MTTTHTDNMHVSYTKRQCVQEQLCHKMNMKTEGSPVHLQSSGHLARGGNEEMVWQILQTTAHYLLFSSFSSETFFLILYFFHVNVTLTQREQT